MILNDFFLRLKTIEQQHRPTVMSWTWRRCSWLIYICIVHLVNQTNSLTNDVTIDIDKIKLKDAIVSNVSYRDRVIRLIAELCKTGWYWFRKINRSFSFVDRFSLVNSESDRKQCVELGLIESLTNALETGNIQNRIESCRAMGNMCYEHGPSLIEQHRVDTRNLILLSSSRCMSNRLG
jgi:hypothetical protein